MSITTSQVVAVSQLLARNPELTPEAVVLALRVPGITVDDVRKVMTTPVRSLQDITLQATPAAVIVQEVAGVSVGNPACQRATFEVTKELTDAPRYQDAAGPDTAADVASLDDDLSAADEAYWERRAKSAETKLKNLVAAETGTRRLIADIARQMPKSYDPAPANYLTPKHIRDTSPQSAVLMLSDTHIGKETTLEQTLEFGHYNTDVFLDRLQQLQDSVISILSNHVSSKIEELVVAMLGDMLDGGLAHGNEADQQVTKFGQFYIGGHAIAQFLRAMAAHVPLVRVYTCVGNHCVDNETEILTKRGWLRYDEVTTDDQCLGLLPDGRTGTWQNVEDVVIEKQVDAMVSIRNREFDFRGTEHHRFYYNIPGHPMLNEARWSEIKSLPIRVPSAAFVNVEPSDAVPDSDLELCAWVLTDGGIYLDSSRVTVFQSKEANLQSIEAAFVKAGFTPIKHERERTRPDSICGVHIAPGVCTEYTFNLTAADSRVFLARTQLEKGKLPPWVYAMTYSQAHRFIQTLIDGDGTRKGTNAILYGKSKAWLDNVQALASMHGIRASVSQYDNGTGPQYRLNLVFDTLHRSIGEQSNISYSKATGETVWCVRTATENFMCRRNGISYFTGNTRWGEQRKMPTKNRFSNLDMMLYAYVQALTADIPNIVWDLNAQPFQLFVVQTSSFFAAHGDHLRGGDRALGIPSHAISRQISNLCQLIDQKGLPNPDYYLFGHFHRSMQLPHHKGKVFVNGAFPGVDEYALTNNFVMSDPEQTLMLVHPRYKAADNWPIQLKFAEPGSSRYTLPQIFN